MTSADKAVCFDPVASPETVRSWEARPHDESSSPSSHRRALPCLKARQRGIPVTFPPCASRRDGPSRDICCRGRLSRSHLSKTAKGGAAVTGTQFPVLSAQNPGSKGFKVSTQRDSEGKLRDQETTQIIKERAGGAGAERVWILVRCRVKELRHAGKFGSYHGDTEPRKGSRVSLEMVAHSSPVLA